MLTNIHTHSPVLSAGLLEIESVYFGQNQAPRAPQRSVGLHPWYLDAAQMETGRSWLASEAQAKEVWAIGEAGLDKVCSTPWDVQLLAFQYCMEISEALQKPLILHCVRAFEEVIALKKVWKPRQTWIFHGFDKNLPTAAMLLRAGCNLSFGAALFRENSRAGESLKAMPADRFFLETDASELPLEKIYARAAALRDCSLADLETNLMQNVAAVFGKSIAG